MTLWEYETLHVETGNPLPLHEYGRIGWELITVIHTGDRYSSGRWFYFKRPLSQQGER